MLRYLWNLINNASGLVPPPKADRVELDRINLLERSSPMYDLTSLHSVASQELHSLRLSQHQIRRPFIPLVREQLEKQRRDRLLRERAAQNRKRHSLKSIDVVDSVGKLVAPAIGVPRKPPTKGTRVGTLLRGFRPHSVAAHFSSGESSPLPNPSSFDTIKSLEDLDFTPNGKPFNVVSIVDSTVSIASNAPRSFVFKLACDDGARHTLQASTKPLLDKWVRILAETSKATSAKRRTLLGDSSKLSPLTEIRNPLDIDKEAPFPGTCRNTGLVGLKLTSSTHAELTWSICSNLHHPLPAPLFFSMIDFSLWCGTHGPYPAGQSSVWNPSRL